MLKKIASLLGRLRRRGEEKSESEEASEREVSSETIREFIVAVEKFKEMRIKRGEEEGDDEL